jgi:hypothetical protein
MHANITDPTRPPASPPPPDLWLTAIDAAHTMNPRTQNPSDTAVNHFKIVTNLSNPGGGDPCPGFGTSINRRINI